MKQLTTKQAVNFGESDIWKDWSSYQICRFQLFQDKLCFPFDVFMKALNDELGRPVYTHELSTSNRESIIVEFLGGKEAPTLEEILNLIPEERKIVISHG